MYCKDRPWILAISPLNVGPVKDKNIAKAATAEYNRLVRRALADPFIAADASHQGRRGQLSVERRPLNPTTRTDLDGWAMAQREQRRRRSIVWSVRHASFEYCQNLPRMVILCRRRRCAAVPEGMRRRRRNIRPSTMPLPLKRSLSNVLLDVPALSSASTSPASLTAAQSRVTQEQISKVDRIQQVLRGAALNFFNHLPVELALMIFTEVVIEETSSFAYDFLNAGLHTHRRMASVCKWWSAVIKGIPRRIGRRLYCNVNLNISTPTTLMSEGDMTFIMRDYLANSGNENLNVLIDLRCAIGSLRPCLLALIAQSRRWRTARIRGDLRDENTRSALANLTGQLPALQTLTLEHIPATKIDEDTEEIDLGFLAHAPALTELSLLGPIPASLINIIIPSNNIIRKFVCDGIETYPLLDCLEEMPGLQELDFAYEDHEDDDVDESGDPEPIEPSLELAHLTKLVLRDTAYAVRGFFVAAVSLPAIKEVTLDSGGRYGAAVLTALKDRKRSRGGDAEGFIVNFLH